jgi:Arc/MetJ-type ribon-helix-helix transcriptional regulator
MEVQLTADQKAFVRQAIQSGCLRREEDAVEEALALWEEREGARAEILAGLDEAEASRARRRGEEARADPAGSRSIPRAIRAHRLSLKAETDLHDIWYYIAL